MVDVITPREGWITSITPRDPAKGLVERWNIKICNYWEPLICSHKYYFSFRVVKEQVVTIYPAYDVA